MFIEQTPGYKELLQEPEIAEPFIQEVFDICEKGPYLNWLLKELIRESSTDPVVAYPGMGLVYDEGGDSSNRPEIKRLEHSLVYRTIQASIYYSLLNNHPDRVGALFAQGENNFVSPEAFDHPLFTHAFEAGQAVNIADIKLEVQGSDKPRQSRTLLHQNGPFVSYFHPDSESRGRKQARGVIAVGANPYITGSPFALARFAESHSLACVPRDGYFSDIGRQRDLFLKTIEFLESSPVFIAYKYSVAEKRRLLESYKRNLVVTIEPESGKALRRARALYDAGARTFRIYSPEPGDDSLKTLVELRKLQKELQWERIEIFVGQVVDVKQAVLLKEAGADAIYVGIGGGGRCITGVVGGLTINWPELVWKLRGAVNIPIIVEGGANDYIAESLAVGASGIGAVGKFAGTIETPGGLDFFVDSTGRHKRRYGGEASGAMRKMAGRVGPFDFILNIEGEVTDKYLRHDAQRLPTVLQVLHELQQGVVGGMVFQNASTIPEFQRMAVLSMRRASPNDDPSRFPHNV